MVALRLPSGVLFAIALATCVRDPGRRAASDAQVHATTHPQTVSPLRDGAVDVVITNESVVPPSGLAAVIDSVRREDWHEARARFERLPASDQLQREGRYLDGRIALELADYPRAITALHGLGEALPALAVDIGRHEAFALSHAGRHAEARAVYSSVAERSRAVRDRAMAAEEQLAAGDTEGAARAMRGWEDDPPQGLERARAWRHAAQAFEAVHDDARAVRAWSRIVVDEPDASAIEEARAALVQHHVDLTVEQWLTRGANLNERARYDTVIRELTPLTEVHGHDEGRRLHVLGRALFHSRSHYAEAQGMLHAASQRSENAERDEDAFLAARALSRSDRDDEAIAAYDTVAHTLHGRWSDEAAFRALWLVAHHDRVGDTVDRATAFLHDRAEATPQMRSEVAWEEAWALYNATRYADAARAFELSGSLAVHAMERGRGRYWRAMAALQSGQTDEAVQAWQGILSDRPMTWYALLAEARLRARGVVVPGPVDPAPRRPAPPLALPDNVRWLRALGFDREGGALLAAQEDALRAHLPHDRADEVMALAYMEMGEEYRAYTLAQRHNDLLDHEPTAESRWVWDCAYPRPYPQWVEAAEDENHLPRHYLYAIMRQESAFNGHDVSNARAIGLLQMIPPTTRHVAQALGIEFREELLFEPAYNIRTGGYYIGRLFAQYHGVLPRAIGAFNAGPNAMARWVTRGPNEETDVFVEKIPYDETRTYVRRVVQNLARYRYLYGPRTPEWPLHLTLVGSAPVDNLVDY